jgi:vacuolar-type H+-ATPase subunit H
MNTKKLDSKIEGVAKKAEQVATAAGAAVKKGAHRLEDTAEKAGHAVDEIVTKVTHTAEETAQKVVHGAQEMASQVRNKGQELRDATGGKSTGAPRPIKR